MIGKQRMYVLLLHFCIHKTAYFNTEQCMVTLLNDLQCMITQHYSNRVKLDLAVKLIISIIESVSSANQAP